jgi:hypothetical protein
MDTHFSSFAEFWPYYVAQHLHPTNRALHFIGTSGVLVCLAAGFMFSPLWFLVMPIAGYGFAWLGHFAFEKNRPATFIHPVWSLRRLPNVPADVDGTDGPGSAASRDPLPGRRLESAGQAPTARRMKAEVVGHPVLYSHDSRIASGASARGQSEKPLREK